MFEGISVTCFGASYLIVLVLELSRYFFRATARNVALIVFALAGWLAHLSFVIYRVTDQWETEVLVSSWESWCWIVSLLLATCYLLMLARHPKSNIGFYLLPLTLLVIIAGIFARELEPFSGAEARSVWHRIHGFSLLIGVFSVFLGFVGGLMYLIQSERLKHHTAAVNRVKSLSLESLHQLAERALIVSTFFVAAGLLSGVVLNIVRKPSGEVVIGWNEPVIWTSAVLFVWLIAVFGFVVLYRPARHGRKIAYLVVASFVFLIVEIAIAVSTDHGNSSSNEFHDYVSFRLQKSANIDCPATGSSESRL